MTDTAAIDAHLITMLRCPVTRSPVALENGALVATVGGLRYPIRDGIPVMLAEEAQLPNGFSSLTEFTKQFGTAAK